MGKIEEMPDDELVSRLIDAASELGRVTHNLNHSSQRHKDELAKFRAEVSRRLNLKNNEGGKDNGGSKKSGK